MMGGSSADASPSKREADTRATAERRILVMTRVVSKRVCVRLDDAMRLFCFPNWGNCHYQWFWRRPRRGSAEKSRGKRKKQLEIAVEKLESTSVRIGASQRVAPTRAVMKRPPVWKRGRKKKTKRAVLRNATGRIAKMERQDIQEHGKQENETSKNTTSGQQQHPTPHHTPLLGI